MKRKIQLILAILFMYQGSAWAFPYTRPTPSRPDLNIEISEIKDTATYSVVKQLHRSLFKIDSQSQAVPDLVSHFEVRKKGKVYILSFPKGLKFHDGTPLKSDLIVKSIKRSLVSSKSHLAQKFGLGHLLSNKANHVKHKRWTHIEALKDDRIVITLSHPLPRLIYFLADPRLSLTVKGNIKNGLGPFQLSKVDSDGSVHLNRIKNNDPKKITKLSYKMADTKKAIQMFKSGKAHDLTLYELNKVQLAEVSNKVKLAKTLFPRTYAFFLNANRLDLETRKEVARRILEVDFIGKCQLAGKENQALVPIGFPGRTLLRKPPKAKLSTEKKIVINIPKEVGEEHCIRKYLNMASDTKIKFEVSIVEFGKVATRWVNNKIDVYYGYIEGESDFSFFEHFLPSSTFPLGSKKDKVSASIHNRLTEATTIKQRHSISSEFSSHLNKQYYYVPLYTPIGNLVFNRNIVVDSSSIQAAYQIDLSEIRREQ